MIIILEHQDQKLSTSRLANSNNNLKMKTHKKNGYNRVFMTHTVCTGEINTNADLFLRLQIDNCKKEGHDLLWCTSSKLIIYTYAH